MSPFFPYRNMAGQARNPPSPGAQTQHRIDSGVSMPPPKYERYQYYSQNSLKERKRILAKCERELAQKLDRISFVSTESLSSTHPFHGLRTVHERRGYWNSLPTYSGRSLPWAPATPEGKKNKRKKMGAFEGDVQEKISHFDRLSLARRGSEGEEEAGWSFCAESVTTFNSVGDGEDMGMRVVSPGVSVATFNTAEDGEYGQRRMVTPGRSVATLDIATDGAYGRGSSRAVVRDGEERPAIIVPHDEAKREEKSLLLNGLFRWPGESRLPAATVPVPVPVPNRLNVKPLWGRKEVLEFEMQEKRKMEWYMPAVEKVAGKTPAGVKIARSTPAVKTARETLAAEKRLPTLSHHKRRSGSSKAPSTDVVAGPSSDIADRRLPMLQRHSRTLPSRSSKRTSKPSPADTEIQRPQISYAASFEERMRYTTLDDLPLGEGGAKRISQLMREVEGDRYGTWPQPKAKRAVADDEVERNAPLAQQMSSDAVITEQVQKRLAQLDDEVAHKCEEEKAQRRQEEEKRRRQEDRAQKRRRDEREQRRREEMRSSTISAQEMVIPPFRPAAPSRPAPPVHQSPPIQPALQIHAASQVSPSQLPPPHRPSSPSSPFNILLVKLDGPPAIPHARPPQPISPLNLENPPFVPPPVNPYLDVERPPPRRCKPRRTSRHAGYVDSSGTLKPVAGSSLRHVVSAGSVASGIEYISGGGDGDVVEEEEYDHPFSPVTLEGATWRDV
ncbi:hypothetical protein HBI56_034850 [Parastagonospora nodorum]|uniref:Uncharacterized protein n=2 Tax=Phaeosphaeria nodorum (strain SN15 / ATCC MYA-4574 / FGSC 10173) TaxID=321614 RepID=A0A7U2EYS8_PHANO|nr:hypothetical protein HBH56_022650 [Parastagonospora nodorum]QRC95603.1 hypothetical protein JI435_032750 [Parastagonospora nodorum SN15]KAH3937142.1 hypothetical protein HBH54_011810 [Parastagonospora nodorum]KAH4136934.1 hypothetical protein HBH45_128950 [Parastagonospora nodorum]KAH4172783.1 hypothetical protein HBH44_012250 [Parastagonospora nodorum]